MRYAILDSVLDRLTREHVAKLVKEELRLLAQQTLADSDQLRIEEIHLVLDRCCDELHQRRAERERRQSLGHFVRSLLRRPQAVSR
jgi:hypothetical protein